MSSLREISLKGSFIEFYRGYCIVKNPEKYLIFRGDKCFFDKAEDKLVVIDAVYRSVTCASIREADKIARRWVDDLVAGIDDDD